MIRHLDLFSGVGGFARAAHWTGKAETIGFCEIDPYCRAVLARNYPGVPIHDDIHTLTGDALSAFGRVDLLTGGYPCQPFSSAGKRLGERDDRHLWPEMRRVIDECRPRYILAENVAGHITLGLDVVLSDLESDGYAWRAAVIPAASVSALHRRDRIWIMASDMDPGRDRGCIADYITPMRSGPPFAVRGDIFPIDGPVADFYRESYRLTVSDAAGVGRDSSGSDESDEIIRPGDGESVADTIGE